MNNFLYKLYFKVPNRIKGRVLRFITKKEGGQMFSTTIRAIFKVKAGIEIGYGSYGGCFSFKNIPPGTQFGNYCSVAPEIRIFRANHPQNHFTTHPILYNPILGYVQKDMLKRPKLVVGHDVWIGELAIILPKVKRIGNGAIVGAGSVVTKDVEPYSIVAGNPARVIGNRFNDKKIEALEKSKWWELHINELAEMVDNFNDIVK